MNTFSRTPHAPTRLRAALALLVASSLAVHADRPAADNLEKACSYSEANGGFSMLVLHDGERLFEGYGNGGAPERRHTLASGTKSFIGVMAAAAVEDGIIVFDSLASDSLSEWKDDPLKARITLRHLLTLTSGLTHGEAGEGGRNPAWKDIIAKPMNGTPGGQFLYGAYHLNAFGEALERKLKAARGETVEQYLERRLLKPLGITLEWRVRCPDGHPQLGGGAAMNARDWAVFGEFMRLQGRWKDRQIVRGDLLAECLRGTKQNPAYGLTWWLKKPVSDEIIQQVPILQRDLGDIIKSDWMPDDLYLAAGSGKQRLYVIPSLKLVVVRQGDLAASRSFSDEIFLSHLLGGSQGAEKPGPSSPATLRPAAPTGVSGMGGSMFGRLDANKDGKVSREEFKQMGSLGQGRLAENPQMLETFFNRLDTNQDGVLSADEMSQLGSRTKGGGAA